jgi:hypothetical protein
LKRKSVKKVNADDYEKFKTIDSPKVLAIGNRLANIRSFSKNSEKNETLLANHIILNDSFKTSESPINNLKKSNLPVVVLDPKSEPKTHAPPPVTPTKSHKDDAQMVDFLSMFLFPVAFIIFNIVYWLYYLNMHVDMA